MNIEVNYQMDTDVNYRMNIDYRMTIVVNYRIDIEGNNSANTYKNLLNFATCVSNIYATKTNL